MIQARKADLDTQALSEADLRSGLRKIIDEFGDLVDDHLDSRSREALEGAQIDDRTFAELRKMFYAIRDPRLTQLGRHVLSVLSNVSATPRDVQGLLKGHLGLNDTEIAKLQEEAVPH